MSTAIIIVATTTSFFFLLMITTDGQATTMPSPAAAAGGGCKPRERDALLAFKEGIVKDPAGLLSSWQRGGQYDGDGDDQLLEEDCCQWRGVRCSNRTGHVVKLNLRNYYADVGTALVGEIGHSLISLEHLKYLDLSMNNLAGPIHGHLPEFLGSFRSMRYLNLSGIMFTGMVPPQLGNLSNLRYLDLSGVRLSGMVSFLYISDASWLAHLPKLQYLNLNGVNLSTVLDWPHILNMIPSLKFLSLSSCSLQSANQYPPQINLRQLEILDLSNNYEFTDQAESSWIWNLTSLKYLNLSSTSLYGEIPQALGNMLSLQVLDFSYNREEDSTGMSVSKKGNMCIMKANLKNLCNLEVLDLDYRLAYGDISEKFESLAQCSPNKLKEVHLANNNLTGILPKLIGRLTSLVTLDLFNNNITGQVPSEIGMLTNLTNLYLHYNYLDGVITEKHFANLTSLKSIYLYYNNYLEIVVDPEWLPPFRVEKAYFASTSMGPSFPSWLQSQVDILELAMSDAGINDTFPDWFSTTFSKATVLEMSYNQIAGGLPTNMENMSLEKLYLDCNQIADRIPRMPRNLMLLDISYNLISGHVPQSICELQKLNGLDLSNNLLEGEFPQCSLMSRVSFFRARMMKDHDTTKHEERLSGCDYKSFVNMKGQELQYDQENVTVVTIDLSSNFFTGVIPEDIVSLDGIINLNLSWNNLNGKIPYMIGAMNSLESLDLSKNKLYGEIPQSLSDLTYLSYLNLSYNNLTGRVPSGTQLGTLYDQNQHLYDGNDDLCGPPLQRSCYKNDASKQGHLIRSKQGFDIGSFSIGVIVGFMAGLWVVFYILLFKESWRIAYFCFLDKMYDEVYVNAIVVWARLTGRTDERLRMSQVAWSSIDSDKYYE
uniref:Leucine-rich repeat-containing N-terminal plant-type domain-containing protein n=1 Tax=Oryza punctata TaxID=4537 RepID=A0A0E0MGD6_ORYPU